MMASESPKGRIRVSFDSCSFPRHQAIFAKKALISAPAWTYCHNSAARTREHLEVRQTLLRRKRGSLQEREHVVIIQELEIPRIEITTGKTGSSLHGDSTAIHFGAVCQGIPLLIEAISKACL
jgi:hypothetical protein